MRHDTVRSSRPNTASSSPRTVGASQVLEPDRLPAPVFVVSPASDLFLAAADLERQLHIHRPGAPPLTSEASLASAAAAVLMALVALILLVAVGSPDARLEPTPAPHGTSVTTDPPVPAGVQRMEYDPIR